MANVDFSPEEQKRRNIALLTLLKNQLANATESDVEALKERIAAVEQQIANPGQPQIVRSERRPHEKWAAVKDLIKSPYRFVPLNDRIAGPEKVWDNASQGRNIPLDDGLCATLTIDWLIETPLLIGEESEEGIVAPLSLAHDKDWVIPGATLRGMIRAALQTVAYGRLWPLNRHHHFGLRDFTHPAYKGEGENDYPVSKSADVKAGWLEKSAKGFTITPCASKDNGWNYIKIENLPCVTDRIDWVTKSRKNKYGDTAINIDWQTDKAFKKVHQFTSVGARDPGLDDKNVLKLDSFGTIAGHLVFSGPGVGPNKKYEYVFFDDPAAKAVTIKKPHGIVLN